MLILKRKHFLRGSDRVAPFLLFRQANRLGPHAIALGNRGLCLLVFGGGFGGQVVN